MVPGAECWVSSFVGFEGWPSPVEGREISDWNRCEGLAVLGAKRESRSAAWVRSSMWLGAFRAVPAPAWGTPLLAPASLLFIGGSFPSGLWRTRRVGAGCARGVGFAPGARRDRRPLTYNPAIFVQ